MPIPPFRLLEYGGGPKGQLLRVLVPGNRVKYILVDIGMWVHGDGSSEKALANMLPLPSNETWKCLRVFKNAGNGELGELPSADMFGLRGVLRTYLVCANH